MSLTEPRPLPSPFQAPLLGAVIRHTVMESPVADLLLVSDGEALTGLYMEGGRDVPVLDPSGSRDPGWFRRVIEELNAYFNGELSRFETPLAPSGTPFQIQVWSALTEIPYGETWSYGALARRVGNPNASRAVGLANGRNPISILVPCHRVIGANGSLTGYGGGLDRKAWLLRHEAVHAARVRGFGIRT